jgi:hypothetical protein
LEQGSLERKNFYGDEAADFPGSKSRSKEITLFINVRKKPSGFARLKGGSLPPTGRPSIFWRRMSGGSRSSTGGYFTYNLRRLGTDRLFSVKFDLTKEIIKPGAPSGWRDQAR